ncbi:MULTISPECIES: ATP-binding protein [unclassified Streptomyces]|uniref:ATP-binding protein n=1 Tax=unclassified Streptomyces TaxID=2593676 RepID=UPI000DC7C626|nr:MULTISPECIES: ATP-binding protein [unclassified Streptomyces]AWZ04317.1 ATP-binding protein [Streptomyces sp. ICC4]AWZ16330.1 ATP-binding protein [Streptomyces sp. ICC1]
MSLSRQQRFPRARASVRAARQFVGDTLGDWGVCERRDDIRLCVSELATNAVLHGVPLGREFSVRLEREGGIVTIGVRDSGPGRPVVQQPDLGAPSGRGLWLVVELADEFRICDERVGKTIWAGFKVGSA